MAKVSYVREETGRLRVQTLNEQESKTVQADRNLADIKEVLRKYEATGVLVNMNDVDLEFRDVSQFEDFQDMMLQLKGAEQAFMRLPPEVRSVFKNDVSTWLDAGHDGLTQAQRSELTGLGILEEVADPQDPVPSPVIPAPQPSPPGEE